MLLTLIAASGVLFMAQPPLAHAQEGPVQPLDRDDPSKWRFSLSYAAVNADLRIINSAVTLPDDLEIGDFTAELADELSVSSNVAWAGVGYRILPFLEVNARAGLISSEASTGLTLTGTPDGPFSNLFTGPVTFDTARDTERSGYSLGLGANAVLPVVKIGDSLLAAYSAFQYTWNEFENSEITSRAAVTSFGLVYPVNLEDRSQPVFQVGASYGWLSREVVQNQVFNGQPISVELEQEFVTPWSLELGASLPLSQTISLGFTASHSLSGSTSGLATIRFRPQ